MCPLQTGLDLVVKRQFHYWPWVGCVSIVLDKNVGTVVHSSSGTMYLALECINSQMLSKDVMIINVHYNHTP